MGKIDPRRGYLFIECRAYGHSWHPREVQRKPTFGVAVDFGCSRCGMKRRSIYTVQGKVTSRFYVPPEGYKAREVSAAEWKAEWLKRMMKGAVEVENTVTYLTPKKMAGRRGA